MHRYRGEPKSSYFTLCLNLGIVDIVNAVQKMFFSTLAKKFYPEFAMRNKEIALE